MPKRERGPSDGGEESRTKRKRGNVGSSSDVEMTGADAVGEGTSGENVTELGLRLWQTVKDAVNKEGRPLSPIFLVKPSKRLYPDYYKIIEQPIALDDIKKKLQTGAYPTLEAVRQDFELCFTNAKTYNLKESDIYKDAKDLLKLTNKAYNKLLPSDEKEGGGKSKPPSIHRMMKSRLLKVIDKTDEEGRVLSGEFLELPNKKAWPVYYTLIKQPQCLENILKHVKRKEYPNLQKFADDVELVFSNAMSFNQDHTQIWEDALTLRDYFRQLMSDLPPPFTLSQYSKPSINKIKIKVPVAAQNISTTDQSKSQGTTLNIRVPPSTKPNPVKASSSKEIASSAPALAPAQVPAPVAVPASAPVPAPAPSTPQPPPAVAAPAPRPAQVSQPTFQTPSYVPAVTHQPTPSHVSTSTPTVTATSNNIKTESSRQTVSASPAPPTSENQLKCVILKTEPRGRSLNLDYRDGVTSWAMRLCKDENNVCIQSVLFLADEEEDSSGPEEDGDEDDTKDADTDVDTNAKAGRRRGKRGRGRPPKTTRSSTRLKAASPAKKKVRKIGEVQVKLNGNIVQENDDQDGKWLLELATGSNTLEVGEKGGPVWKVYTERIA
ncbi:Bromodomain-containing protein [Dendrothele bispora CBS 962.96]|uniref:Bromodomain-containing protein n=1 Tax=Dendrothele bispora (strain CBS 962.96) TaxID=1314807 RepID=A0A4S8MWJ2_DENBC|nr:Bromodomain-containing protein [Dendrothele bispora CBS 962.96]